jgi:hypothetical protein
MIDLQKIPPYQRLQNIFSEEKESLLTNKANNNINKLLGIEDKEIKPSIFNKISKIFLWIDSKIFSKNSKISSRYQKR